MTSDHSKKPLYEFCPKPWCKISLINQTNYNAQKHVDACTEDKNKTLANTKLSKDKGNNVVTNLNYTLVKKSIFSLQKIYSFDSI